MPKIKPKVRRATLSRQPEAEPSSHRVSRKSPISQEGENKRLKKVTLDDMAALLAKHSRNTGWSRPLYVDVVGAMELLRTVFSYLRASVLKRKAVVFPHICTVWLATKKARNFRHPKTGDIQRIPKKKYLKMRMSVGLREELSKS